MPVTIRCSQCRAQLRVGDEHLGKKVRCPKCQAVITAAANEPAIAEIVESDIVETEVAETEAADAGYTERPRRRPRRHEEDAPDDEKRPRRRRDAPERYARDEDRDRPDRERPDRERPDRERYERRRRERYDRDEDDWLEDRRERSKRRERPMAMPPSVVLAVAALCVLFVLELALAGLALTVAQRDQLPRALGQLIGAFVVGGLVLWGLLVGHRLAWQWGRLLGSIAAVVYLLAAIAVIAGNLEGLNTAAAKVVVGAFGLVMSACLWTIVFSLGTTPAREYFDLRCPRCGKFTNAAGDFFFNWAKCKKCRTQW